MLTNKAAFKHPIGKPRLVGFDIVVTDRGTKQTYGKRIELTDEQILADQSAFFKEMQTVYDQILGDLARVRGFSRDKA